jgi:uncharacterized protein
MFVLILIGISIGLVLGLTGAGGSVFAVPLLVYLGKMSLTDAMGMSLGAVMVSSLYASVRNRIGFKKNAASQSPVLWVPGAILAFAGVITAPLGKWLSVQLPDSWLIAGFSLLAAIIALRMWWMATHQPELSRVIRAGQFVDVITPDYLCNLSATGQFLLRPRCVSGLLLGGALVGILSGLFGVGGGFLIVPLLLMLSAVSMVQAVSTSLLIIAMISSSGFISHIYFTSSMNWMLLIWIATAAVVGMLFGQFFGQRFANALLQKIFAVSLFLVSIFMMIEFLIK